MRKNEHLFPKFHVRPPRGFVNDPNGPCLIDGVFHLFYQYRHATDASTPVVWGHVSSPDLAKWTHYRSAITPLPGGPDSDGIYSGNTVVNDGIVRAFYSGKLLDHPHQLPLLAKSENKGASFGAPRHIIPAPSVDEVHTFRDPYVWRTPGGWAMVVGAGTNAGNAEARLYTSDDLDHWTPSGNLAAMARRRVDGLDTGEMWECPQVVVEAEGKLILIVSAWSRTERHHQLMSLVAPTSDGMHFAGEPVIAPYDYGPNLYAVSTMNESPLGPLAWGWVKEGRDPAWSIEEDWSGMLSLPRQIRSGRSGRVESTPPESLQALRTGSIPSGAGHGVSVPAQFEFAFSVASGKGDARLDLAFSEDERLQLIVDRGTGKATIDRSRASRDPRADVTGCEMPDREARTDAPARFRGFVDGSVLELFRDDGAVVTVRFYPLSPPPWTIDTTGGAGDALDLWAL
jgi:beta-fructofuranosidase